MAKFPKKQRRYFLPISFGVLLSLTAVYFLLTSEPNAPAFDSNTNERSVADRRDREIDLGQNPNNVAHTLANAFEMESPPWVLDESVPIRVAVIPANRSLVNEDKQVGIITGWLEASLSQTDENQRNLQVFDRQDIGLVFSEASISLSPLVDQSPSSIRYRFDPLQVDRLLLIEANNIPMDQGQPNPQGGEYTTVNVVDTSTGLRLASHRVAFDEFEDPKTQAILSSLRLSLATPVSDMTVFAVSPVADARLQPGGDEFSSSLQERIAEKLQSPRRIQMELSEAQALGTEMMIGGTTMSVAAIPWHILLRVSDLPDDSSRLRLQGMLQYGGIMVDDMEIDGEAKHAEKMVNQIVDRFSPLISRGALNKPVENSALVIDLQSRAEQLLANSQLYEALDLMETALLYDPADVELRIDTVAVLLRRINLELDPFDFPLDKTESSSFANAMERVDQWHRQGLDHLERVANYIVWEQRPPDFYYLHPGTEFVNATQRLFSRLETRVPDQWGNGLTAPDFTNLRQRSADFKYRMLSLVRSHKALPVIGGNPRLFGRNLWDVASMAEHPGKHYSEDPGLTKARVLTHIHRRIQIPSENKYSIGQANDDVLGAPQATIESINQILPAIEDPWMRMVLEEWRGRAFVRVANQSQGASFSDTPLHGTWPPGMQRLDSTIENNNRWSTLRHAANYDRLPLVKPRRLLINQSMSPYDHFAGMVPCGGWGDVIWTRHSVLLLTPRGDVRQLIGPEELPTGRQYKLQWVRNVSFDGQYLWVLIPGKSTTLHLIDPTTEERLTFGETDGLPPTSAGGSVVSYESGRGVAFGSFQEDGLLRTWYATLQIDQGKFGMQILRSDKSEHEAEARDSTGDEGRWPLTAVYANRLAVSRNSESNPRVLVLGEAMDTPHNRMGDPSNNRAQMVIIDPAAQSVRPALTERWYHDQDFGRDWVMLDKGQLIYEGVGGDIYRRYDPFTDQDQPAHARTRFNLSGRYSSMEKTPKGLFAVLELDPVDEQHFQAVICRTHNGYTPPRPVARMQMPKGMTVAGWSDQHGLMLLSEHQQLYAVPIEEVEDWPEPQLNFQMLADDNHAFVGSIKHWKFDDYTYLLLASDSFRGNGDKGYSYQEAADITTAYMTNMPTKPQLADAKTVIRNSGVMGWDSLSLWTSLRTQISPDAWLRSGRLPLKDDQLLPPGDLSGYPVRLDIRGLAPVRPEDRYAILLAFRPPPNVDPLPPGIVPRLIELPPGTAIVGLDQSDPLYELNPQRQITIPPGLFMMEMELTAWQRMALLDLDSIHNTSIGDQNKDAWSAARNQYHHARDLGWICDRLRELTGERWRVPTEAEWEYACRAGSPGPSPSNESLHQMGTIRETNGLPPRHYVRQHRPNAWGFYDMHGGEGELAMVDTTPEEFEKWIANTPRRRPRLNLVIRGGSMFDTADHCRIESRALPGDFSGVRLIVDRRE